MRSGPAWQNPDNPLDVSGDGFVVPRDALLVINEINSGGPRFLDPPTLDGSPSSPPPFVDVTGDGTLSARDALVVINFLNEQAKIRRASAAVARSSSNAQIIGAALDIAPRNRVAMGDLRVLDEVFEEETNLQFLI